MEFLSKNTSQIQNLISSKCCEYCTQNITQDKIWLILPPIQKIWPTKTIVSSGAKNKNWIQVDFGFYRITIGNINS